MQQTKELENFYHLAITVGFDLSNNATHPFNQMDSNERLSTLIDWSNEFEMLHRHVLWNEHPSGDYIDLLDGFYLAKVKALASG